MPFPLRAIAVLAVMLSTLPADAVAEAYPDKPVRMIVSYAPGNVTDVVARLIGRKLSEMWKQQVVIENRPGAGGSLGADLVAKSPADGYTLLFTAVAPMAINPHIYSTVRYNPLTDFTPVALVALAPLFIVVHPSVPASNLRELIDYTKAHPGKLNWATPGNGTFSHFALSYLKLNAGLEAEHIPSKASTTVITDLIAGRVEIGCEAWTVVVPHIKSGAVRALAVTSPQRSDMMASVPTVAESVPGWEAAAWLGIMAPSGVAAEIVRKINADVLLALNSAEVREALQSNGLQSLPGSPAEFATRLRNDFERYALLVKRTGLKIE